MSLEDELFEQRAARVHVLGLGIVEYALLVALIAVICIVAIAFLGKSASSKFSTVGSSVGS